VVSHFLLVSFKKVDFKSQRPKECWKNSHNRVKPTFKVGKLAVFHNVLLKSGLGVVSKCTMGLFCWIYPFFIVYYEVARETGSRFNRRSHGAKHTLNHSHAAHVLTRLKLPHSQKFFGILGISRWPERPVTDIFGVQREGSLESFKNAREQAKAQRKRRLISSSFSLFSRHIVQQLLKKISRNARVPG